MVRFTTKMLSFPWDKVIVWIHLHTFTLAKSLKLLISTITLQIRLSYCHTLLKAEAGIIS